MDQNHYVVAIEDYAILMTSEMCFADLGSQHTRCKLATQLGREF